MSMNPQIQTVGIGVKDINQITIYPLSMADQFKLSDIIAGAITDYSNVEGDSDVEYFQVAMTAIQDNLITILNLITEKEDVISLDNITNAQFAELCDIIYSINFDTAVGKLQALFQRAKKAFRLKTPSPKLSSVPVTDTNTSTTSHSEMGE